MWVVAKIKSKQLNIFKKNLSEKLGNDIKFYCPKIQYYSFFGNKQRKLEKLALENYIFCFHSNFKKLSSINNFKFLKGLDYFLSGYYQNQYEILEFIKYCKSFENNEGYLTQNFFKTIITRKAKFISGPFTNMIFEILEKKKNKLQILVGDIVTTVSDKADYLYRPI